jgi:hypothetical protein
MTQADPKLPPKLPPKLQPELSQRRWKIQDYIEIKGRNDAITGFLVYF